MLADPLALAITASRPSTATLLKRVVFLLGKVKVCQGLSSYHVKAWAPAVGLGLGAAAGWLAALGSTLAQPCSIAAHSAQALKAERRDNAKKFMVTGKNVRVQYVGCSAAGVCHVHNALALQKVYSVIRICLYETYLKKPIYYRFNSCLCIILLGYSLIWHAKQR
jgi:hypothetical protein